MICTTHSIAVVGLRPHPVEVEADVSRGMPRFTIVGLPDTAVNEARERVHSALLSSNLGFPDTRIIVNLAPADLRKEGPGFDLAIAMAIAASSGRIDEEAVRNATFLGELSLDGRIRAVPGVLPAAIHHRHHGRGKTLVIPRANRAEASHVPGLEFVAVENLRETISILTGDIPVPMEARPLGRRPAQPSPCESSLDFACVRGQPFACRALLIMAAGGHHALLFGPPGSGKSMLANCLPGILPALQDDAALDVTQIYSVAGLLPESQGIIQHPPFRSPHHTCSIAGLVGGGTRPRPGEISLAHHGVLFLDEALEFPRNVLESLRQPLESGHITLSHAQCSLQFPACILLLMALNPCPCGYRGDGARACTCSTTAVARYRSRLSGPLSDRIDLHLEVSRQDVSLDAPCGPPSRQLADQVVEAQARQRARNDAHVLNGRLPAKALHTACELKPSSRKLLDETVQRMNWSARTLGRLLRVARTIADLEGACEICDDHLWEAIALRRSDFAGTAL